MVRFHSIQNKLDLLNILKVLYSKNVILCLPLFYFYYFLMFTMFAQRHAFHLVDPSALPFLTAMSALSLTSGSLLYFHGYSGGLESTFFGIFCVILCFYL